MSSDTPTFQDQSAVVTGAGEGIGFEIARQLALKGASVLLNDVREDRAKEAAASIRYEGGVCIGAGGDVGEVDVVRTLVEEAVTAFGRLDIAVANAGLSLWSDLFTFEPDDFNRLLSVNLGGSFFLAQAAARQMREQTSGGNILFLSSVTGHRAVEQGSAYGMTKRALEMLARSLGVELAAHGISVNAVAPGATVTPRTLDANPNYVEDWSAITPTRRPAYPKDIAHAALFLLSPSSRHITGQTLLVDGGWTAVSPTPPNP